MRKAAFDAIYLNHLKNACNIPTVTKVACHEMASCNMMFVIQLDRPELGQPWQALRAAAAFDPSLGKIFIAVDVDVDPDSMNAILWALSYAMQPHRDTEIIRGKVPRLDPSISPSDDVQQLAYPDARGSSSILINACREHPYPPVSLPGRGGGTSVCQPLTWKRRGMDTRWMPGPMRTQKRPCLPSPGAISRLA